MHFVRNATYVSEYKLLLTFEDGSVKLVDLEPHLDGEVFEPLKDINYFKTVRVSPDLDTIAWENGADMSPDFLYEIGASVPEEAKALDQGGQEQLRELPDKLSAAPPTSLTEDEFEQKLLEVGILSKVPPPIADLTPYRNRKPIEVKGRPTSEVIIEERR